jgi:hypothetical protein
VPLQSRIRKFWNAVTMRELTQDVGTKLQVEILSCELVDWRDLRDEWINPNLGTGHKLPNGSSIRICTHH